MYLVRFSEKKKYFTAFGPYKVGVSILATQQHKINQIWGYYNVTILKIQIFGIVTMSSMFIDSRRFEGLHRLHFKGLRNSRILNHWKWRRYVQSKRRDSMILPLSISTQPIPNQFLKIAYGINWIQPLICYSDRYLENVFEMNSKPVIFLLQPHCSLVSPSLKKKRKNNLTIEPWHRR
jgi:hypothetical protein